MPTRGGSHYSQFDDPFYQRHPEDTSNQDEFQLSQQEISENSSPKGDGSDDSSIDSFQGSQSQADMQAAFLAGTMGIPPPVIPPTDPSPEAPPAMTQNTSEAVGALMGLQANIPPPPIAETQQQIIPNVQQTIPQQRQQNLQVQPIPNPSPHTSVPTTNDIFELIQANGFSGLTEDEQQEIAACHRGANHEKYIRNQDALEVRFFETLENFGGVAMEKLSQLAPVNDGTGLFDRLFYLLLSGEKTERKRVIVDRCMVLIAQKWRKLSPPKEAGDPYQPSAWNKMMQQLFLVFRQKGMKFDFKKDFNGKGEFHGQMKTKWAKIRLTDPTFGTQSRKAKFDIEVDRKFRQSIKDGIIKPYEDPIHATMTVQFTLGRYLAFRGSKEHHQLLYDHVHRRQYGPSDGAELDGLNYYGVKVDEDKMNQLGFTTPTLPGEATHLLTFCESPKDTLFDPVRFFDFYIDRCHPDAKFFLARKGTVSQIRKWSAEAGRPIWYGPAGSDEAKPTAYKISEKTIAKNFVNFAQLVGCEDWERCTGQGLRALCITLSIQAQLPAADTARLARHRSIKSQESYERESNVRIANRHAALKAPVLEVRNESQDESDFIADNENRNSRPNPPPIEVLHVEDRKRSPLKDSQIVHNVPVPQEMSKDEREELEFLRHLHSKKQRMTPRTPMNPVPYGHPPPIQYPPPPSVYTPVAPPVSFHGHYGHHPPPSHGGGPPPRYEWVMRRVDTPAPLPPHFATPHYGPPPPHTSYPASNQGQYPPPHYPPYPPPPHYSANYPHGPYYRHR
jgi:hypothetical protein